jgi:glycosyltransferase involved in cell wall biosynthesis
MKVIQLIANTEFGGVTQIANLIAEGLIARGHEVETYFLYSKKSISPDVKDDRTLFYSPPKGLNYLKIAIELWSLLKTQKPDAVITHMPKTGILGHFLARILRVKRRIAVLHNPIWAYSKLARWLDLFWGFSGFYTDNVAVSHAIERSVARYPRSYKRKFRVIYNGIPRLEQPPVSREEVRTRWNLPQDCFLLVNVGRLSYQKNHTAILKALSNLPDVHLAIVGEGELRDKLAAEAKQLEVSDRVHFIGEVPSCEIPSILHASDLFVFPSHFEGMSISLLEVMQVGKPVIASNIPSNVELLGDTALFVNPEDFTDLEKKVRMLQENSALRQDLIEKAKARAASFSLENMADNYEKLITAQTHF